MAKMSAPYSYTKRFVLDDVTFHRYSAQDAHGTRVDTFYINGVLVGHNTFMSRLRKSMEDTGMLREMLTANGANSVYRPDWVEEPTLNHVPA